MSTELRFEKDVSSEFSMNGFDRTTPVIEHHFICFDQSSNPLSAKVTDVYRMLQNDRVVCRLKTDTTFNFEKNGRTNLSEEEAEFLIKTVVDETTEEIKEKLRERNIVLKPRILSETEMMDYVVE